MLIKRDGRKMREMLSTSFHLSYSSLFSFCTSNYHHGNCKEAIKVHVAMETVNKDQIKLPQPTCAAMLYQIHYHIPKLHVGWQGEVTIQVYCLSTRPYFIFIFSFIFQLFFLQMVHYKECCLHIFYIKNKTE